LTPLQRERLESPEFYRNLQEILADLFLREQQRCVGLTSPGAPQLPEHGCSSNLSLPPPRSDEEIKTEEDSCPDLAGSSGQLESGQPRREESENNNNAPNEIDPAGPYRENGGPEERPMQ
jgi:hypothetical protein